MEQRVAAWESTPWEAGGRGGCRAWRKDGRHENFGTPPGDVITLRHARL